MAARTMTATTGAVLLIYLLLGVAAVHARDMSGVYNAVTRGAMAAGDAKPSEEMGTSAWSVGSIGGNSGGGYDITTELTLDCAKENDTRTDRSGFKWQSVGHCDASQITLRYCDKLAKIGAKCESSDWSNAQTVTSGSNATFGETSVTAECTSYACDLVLKRKGSVTQSASSLDNAGRQAVADSTDNDGRVSRINETAESSDYLGYRRTAGQRMQLCSNRIQHQAEATGNIVDCEGIKRAELTFSGTDCGERCIQAETATSTTTESCIATVPSNKQVCTTTFGTHECLIQQLPSGDTANSCQPGGNPAAGCGDTQTECDITRTIVPKVCHYEYGRIEPKYRCPNGFEYKPEENLCIIAPSVSCPTGTHYPGHGEYCVPNSDSDESGMFEDVACPAGYHPGAPSWYSTDPLLCSAPASGSCPPGGHLVTQTYTGPDNQPRTRKACIATRSCPNGMNQFGTLCMVPDPESSLPEASITCPIDSILNQSYSLENSRCELPLESLGDFELPTKYFPGCPAGYVLNDDESGCHLDSPACANGQETAPGKKMLDVTTAIVATPRKGLKSLEYWWSAGGTKLDVDWRDYNQQATVCDPDRGWIGILVFDLPHGTDRLASFHLNNLHFDDNMVVTLNGQQVYSSGFSCTDGNGNNIDLNVNLAGLLRPTANVLMFKAYGGPSDLVLGGQIDITVYCKAPSTLTKGIDTDACPDDGVVHNSGGTTHKYYCGVTDEKDSDCADEDVREWYYEGESNKSYNYKDELESWDELYTQDVVDEDQCEEADSPFCRKIEAVCVDADPQIFNGVEVTRECFHTVNTYDCKMGGNVAQCLANPVPGDCSLSSTECLQTDDSGACIVEQEDYLCTGTGTTEHCTEPIKTTLGCGPETTECAETNSAGDCIKKVTVRTCYSDQPDRCINDEQCTLTDTSCHSSDASGLCGEQEQNYSCERETTSCVETEAICKQDEDGTLFGGQFNRVVAAESKANALLQMAKREGKEFSGIRIMPGEAVECHEDKYGGALGVNCCSDDADSTAWFDQCDEEEKKLAEAKRADRTHYIGRWCSHKLPIIGCTQYRETYCQFNSLLARLVHEQGRPQLEHLAQSTAGTVKHDTFSVPYMAGNGGWNTHVNVRGHDIYGYTWDSACMNLGTQGQDQKINCPMRPQMFIAACEGINCPIGQIPEPYASGANDTDWTLHHFAAEKGARTITLAKNINAGGDCIIDDDADGGISHCTVKITSWPRGDDGRVPFTIDLSWPLFRDPGETSGWTVPVRNAGRYKFQPFQVERTDGVTMPDDMPIKVSVDDGAYSTFTIPTVIPAEGLELATTPPTTIYGQCIPEQNWCRMRAETMVEINDKPWCDGDCEQKHEAHCEGFTIAEFMALDFSQMDLSEFTSKVSDNVPTEAVMESAAQNAGQAGADQFVDDYANSADRYSTSTGTDQVFTLRPLDGKAPWETTAQVAQQMNTDEGIVKVNSVTIDWGDGSSQTLNPAGMGAKTEVTHEYIDEDDRDVSVVATFKLTNGQVRRTRAKVHTWTHSPPKIITNLGGGQSGGGSYRTDETTGGKSGNLGPPPAYEQ